MKDHLLCWQEDAQEDRHSVSDHAEACSPGADACMCGAGPMKMPLDLIARAISTGAESTCSAVDKVVMQTWDFAGQQMYYNMAHVFMTAIGIYVLVLDLSAWSRGDATPMDLTESMDFWLAALLVHAADARLVLVGSHADLLDDSNRKEVYKKIDDYLAKNLQHNRILGNEQDDLLFFPVDNRRCTDSGLRSIQHLRNELSKLALEVAEEMGTIPTRWAHLFHVLEGMEADCISLESCRAMGAELGIGRGELEECLGRFHRLGQLLYFQGSPSVVLKPQWLLDAMAQVVGCPVALRQDPLRARKLKQGGLTEELLQVLWQDEKFRGHQPVLQAFLEHFDLLVPGEKGWLVPNLLPLRPQQSDCNQEAVTLILDFKGAFGRLLPTLIPRLLCQLRKRPELKLKVFEVFRDWARLSLFDPALLVTFDLYPAACPEVLRLQAVTRSAQRLKELLDSVHLAMQAWLPQVAYSTNLPCPCGAVQRDHLLDLTKLLREEPFLCPSTNNLVSPNSEIIRSWRELEAGEKSAASSGPAPAAMYYLCGIPG
ncbi:unnamed protein product [Effrenium voratum]|nr:unnamed protein product [Effrenium voratum]